jgi:hypothetical protein
MIRLGTQDDLQQIDIFDEFGGDRIQEIKENRLTVYLIAHLFQITLTIEILLVFHGVRSRVIRERSLLGN